MPQLPTESGSDDPEVREEADPGADQEEEVSQDGEHSSRSYYYDDAYGYEDYDPEKDDIADTGKSGKNDPSQLI